MGKPVAGLRWAFPRANRFAQGNTVGVGQGKICCKPVGSENHILLKLHFVLTSCRLGCLYVSIKPQRRPFFIVSLNKCHRTLDVSWNWLIPYSMEYFRCQMKESLPPPCCSSDRLLWQPYVRKDNLAVLGVGEQGEPKAGRACRWGNRLVPRPPLPLGGLRTCSCTPEEPTYA